MSAGKARLPAAMTIRVLIALFALAVTIPYLVLLGENLYSELADEYAGAYLLARVLADSTASDTARFVADTKGLAAHLATRPALRALDTGRCDRFLSDLLPTLQHITNILTVDANGRLRCSATPITAQTPKSVPPHYWFNEVRRTRATVVGRPARGFITGKWVVTIAEPILDARGRFLGAVGIAMELVRFRPLRGGEDVPEGTAIRVLNRDGIVIASMLDEDRWIGRDVSDHAAIKAIITNGEGSLRMPGLDGIDRLIAFRAVRGTDWIAGAGVPAQAAFAAFDRRLHYTLLSFVAAILVSIATGTWLARRITRPLRALSATAQAVANGNLQFRAECKGPLEIENVARQFNRMLDAQAATARDLRSNEARLRLFFEHSPAALAMLDRDMRYLAVSRRWTKDYQLDEEQVLGRSHYELFPDLPEHWKAVHRRCLDGASESSDQDEFRRSNGRTDWVRWAILPWQQPEGTVGGIIIFSEVITERVRAQAMLAAAQTVLDAIARGTALPLVLERLVRAFQAQAHHLTCSILLLDDDGRHLRHGAAPSLPAEYVQAIDGSEIGARAGSCGTAAFRRERVIVEDIATDPLWTDYRAPALQHGLRACWSEPVFDERGRLLATFACYYHTTRGPSPFHLHLVHAAVGLAAIAISHSGKERSLRQATVEMQMLSRRLLEAEAAERRRLAAELHDRVGPNLASLGLNLQILRLELPAAVTIKSGIRLADAQRLIEQTTSELRSVMHDLRPEELDDFGLKAALGFFAEQAGQRAGFSVQMRADDALPALPVGVETELYRIGREAVANAAKHAAATQLTIDLGIVNDRLVLRITDNGRGMPQNTAGGTRGLRSMRERALAMGADLAIDVLPDGGTRITVTLDHPARSAHAA